MDIHKKCRQIVKHGKFVAILAADRITGFTITTNRVTISENRLNCSKLCELVTVLGISKLFLANEKTEQILTDIKISREIDMPTKLITKSPKKVCPSCCNMNCHRFIAIFEAITHLKTTNPLKAIGH